MPSPLCGVALCVAKCFGCHQDGTDPCSEAIPPVVRRECGNLASIIWNLTLGGIVNVLCLSCNADRLNDNMRVLMAEKADVMRKAADAAESSPQGAEILTVVQTWGQRVVELNDKVEELHRSVHSWAVVVKFPCLSYGAKELLGKVEDLRREMNTGESFRVLVGPVAPPSIVSQAVTSSTIHPRLSEARQHLVNDQIGVVGVSGAAGIDNTALLQALNNEPCLPGVHGFDPVIWIPVSSNPTVADLQTVIGNRLGLSLAKGPADEQNRASALNRALSPKRFLLLLDDVRDPGTLRNIFDRVGIPDLRPKKSKIVFTTVSGEIARSGDVELVLGPLDVAPSWEVFYKNLSEKAKKAVDRDVVMKATADDIVQLCDGSPSVLVNVARAISGAHPSPDQWEIFLEAWRHLIDKLPGMEPILRSLQLTYDLLSSDATRTCFLYCCLFPERYSIDKARLVEYWVGEGLLDKGKRSYSPIDIVRSEGFTRIRNLADVSLLRDLGKTVVLPESARRLAVTSKGSEKFVLFAGRGCLEVRGVESWSDAERVSFMLNDIRRLPESIPECQNLHTLLINDNPRLEIGIDGGTSFTSSSSSPAAASTVASSSSSSSSSPAKGAAGGAPSSSSSSSALAACNDQRALFGRMKGLRVLDLSSTSIGQLPSDIRLLGELMYLNLSNTSIRDLPDGLGDLAKLRQLDLSGTKQLKQLRHGIISKLGRLQALNLYDSGYCLCFDDPGEHDGWESLLRTLRNLDELGVNIKTPFPWRTLPEAFVRFQSSTRFLQIVSSEKVAEQVFDVCQFPILEFLRLSNLPFSSVMAEVGSSAGTSRPPLQRLRHLYVSECDEGEDLEWVQRLLPRLAIHRSGEGKKEMVAMPVECLPANLSY